MNEQTTMGGARRSKTSMAGKPIRIGMFANIAGQEQWVTIRGGDTGNPVLLVIGGPGGALSALAPFFEPWEQRFTLVQWDQPGAGSTHALHGDAGLGDYTLDRLTRDAIAVAEFAAHYLGIDKLVLLGLSGGSILGLRVAAERPDLLAAYVGSGQIVHWQRQMALSYERLLDNAARANDEAALAELRQIGPPPWRTLEDEVVASKYSGALTAEEQAELAALDPAVLAAMQSPPPGADYVAPGVEIGDQRPQATRMFARLRAEIWNFDAWRLGTRFAVPMLFLQGEHDAMTVTSEVERFAHDLDAPRVAVVTVPGASHTTFFRRQTLLQLLHDTL